MKLTGAFFRSGRTKEHVIAADVTVRKCRRNSRGCVQQLMYVANYMKEPYQIVGLKPIC